MPYGDHRNQRNVRQTQAALWGRMTFGVEQATSIPQRALRMVEEAIEVAQTAGVPHDMLKNLVDHVYSREPGDLPKEIGQVGVTLLVLAEAMGISADAAEACEIEQVLSKPMAHYAERNKAKNDGGFLILEKKEGT